MSYTIISAQYANEDSTAVVIVTKECAAVAISERDTPEDWRALQTWSQKKGNSISAMPPPPPPPSKSERLSRLLQAQGLTVEDLKTELSK